MNTEYIVHYADKENLKRLPPLKGLYSSLKKRNFSFCLFSQWPHFALHSGRPSAQGFVVVKVISVQVRAVGLCFLKVREKVLHILCSNYKETAKILAQMVFLPMCLKINFPDM